MKQALLGSVQKTRESSFERHNSFPGIEGASGLSIDGAFSSDNKSSSMPSTRAAFLSNSFVPSVLRQSSAGFDDGPMSSTGLDSAPGNSSIAANQDDLSAKTQQNVNAGSSGKRPGGDSYDSSDDDSDSVKLAAPAHVASMSAEEFDEKVRQLNAKRAAGQADDSLKTGAYADRKAKCDVFDTVEKLVCNVMQPQETERWIRQNA